MQILYLLEKYQVLVVVGETGCGKSTQLPQVNLLFYDIYIIRFSIWPKQVGHRMDVKFVLHNQEE